MGECVLAGCGADWGVVGAVVDLSPASAHVICFLGVEGEGRMYLEEGVAHFDVVRMQGWVVVSVVLSVWCSKS